MNSEKNVQYRFSHGTVFFLIGKNMGTEPCEKYSIIHIEKRVNNTQRRRECDSLYLR